MTASSQTPISALPPELALVQRPMRDAERAAYAAYGVAIPAPAGTPDTPAQLVVDRPEPLWPMCFRCGNRRGPLAQHDQERYASGAQVLVCSGVCAPGPRHAATQVLRSAMEQGRLAPAELADAEECAGLLFDPQRASDIATAAYEQAKTEDGIELAQAAQDRQAREWFHTRWASVGRLCEDRFPDDVLRVDEVLAALDARAPATLPLTLRWDGTVTEPSGDGPGAATLVGCTTARGGKAVLVLDQDQRQPLASRLDLQVRDVTTPCPTAGCGTEHDLDASDLFGWSRLEIASLGDGPRWYCSDMCVFDALARAGHDLAADDQLAAADPEDPVPFLDTTGVEGLADELDERYGAGASDEYALQVAEATEATFEDERGNVDEAEDGAR